MPKPAPPQGHRRTGIEPARGLVAKPPVRPKRHPSPLFAGKQRLWPKRKTRHPAARTDPEALGFIGGDANTSTPHRRAKD